MSLESLVKATLAKMGTKQQRAAAHTKRSEEFNKHAEKELKSMQLTDELLRKRCTL